MQLLYEVKLQSEIKIKICKKKLRYVVNDNKRCFTSQNWQWNSFADIAINFSSHLEG